MKFSIDPRTLISPQTDSALNRKQRDLQSLKKSSREFETLYVMEMFKAMRKSVPKGGLFEKDMSTEIFQEMLDMETAKTAAKGKGLGIAEMIYKQMAPLIENKK
ncbi:MAG: rod-binding protein [Deltaproteobacteria bacterium]|nr:rod-binding protein [Deltaproteobacteria bacterium]